MAYIDYRFWLSYNLFFSYAKNEFLTQFLDIQASVPCLFTKNGLIRFTLSGLINIETLNAIISLIQQVAIRSIRFGNDKWRHSIDAFHEHLVNAITRFAGRLNHLDRLGCIRVLLRRSTPNIVQRVTLKKNTSIDIQRNTLHALCKVRVLLSRTAVETF